MAGSDVFTGTLDLLILRTLRAGPRHGYAIGRWIRDTSSDTLEVEEGVLYPALHRLEKRGLIKAEWGQTELNRPGRFYRLTPAGRKHLQNETSRWREHVRAVAAVLDAVGG
jgi:PadR family transcriptional regulator, regulatory protein PadR